MAFEFVICGAPNLVCIVFSLHPTLSFRWTIQKIHNAKNEWSTFSGFEKVFNQLCLKLEPSLNPR